MYGSLIVYALTLIGPAALAGGYRPETRGGLLTALAGIVCVLVLLGRFLLGLE